MIVVIDRPRGRARVNRRGSCRTQCDVNSPRVPRILASFLFAAMTLPACAADDSDDGDSTAADDSGGTGGSMTGASASDSSASTTASTTASTSASTSASTTASTTDDSATDGGSTGAAGCDGDLSPLASSPFGWDLACLGELCCDAATACAANAGCVAYDACLFPCLSMGDVDAQQSCIMDCQAQNAPAEVGYDVFSACASDC